MTTGREPALPPVEPFHSNGREPSLSKQYATWIGVRVRARIPRQMVGGYYPHAMRWARIEVEAVITDVHLTRFEYTGQKVLLLFVEGVHQVQDQPPIFRQFSGWIPQEEIIEVLSGNPPEAAP